MLLQVRSTREPYAVPWFFMEGQDIGSGTRTENAPAAPDPEARRSTVQVKLRLSPADALRLRASARDRGLEVSAYVSALLDDPSRASAPPSALEVPLASVSRLAGLLGLLPEEVRRSRGELGRAFGLLKHLFEQPVSVANAERHAQELSAAVRDARGAIARVEASVESLVADLAPLRSELAATARRLCGRGP